MKMVVFIKLIAIQSVLHYFCHMTVDLQKHYKAIIQGALLTCTLYIILKGSGLMIVESNLVSPPIYFLLNFLSIVTCWVLLSFLSNKYSLFRILFVIAFLLATTLAERYLNVGKNPLTIPLIILFWIGVASLLIPQFFKKYKKLIFSVYGLVISYHFFNFYSTPIYTIEHRVNFVTFMFIPIPVFVTLWVYEQWRWLKSLQADKVKTELTLLKSQINPHFFFNTLNNLYGLAVEKSEKTPEVILKLSEMMRYSVYNGQKDLVSVEDEIQYLENYIELHKLRYKKDVDIKFTHDIEESVMVTPLLFIILVENAFKHGAEKMRSNAYIHLRMATHINKLSFTCENNFDPSQATTPVGIGIDNLKKRLAFYYPNRHSFKIEQSNSTYKVELKLEL